MLPILLTAGRTTALRTTPEDIFVSCPCLERFYLLNMEKTSGVSFALRQP